MEYENLVVYHRGAFRPYPQAQVGLLTHALLYGTGCFEGMRAFWNAEHGELYVCEPSAHFRRLVTNARLLLMDLPPVAELTAIATELCRRNGFREDVYLRPVAYKSEEALGVRLDDLAHDFFIVAAPRVRLKAVDDGLTACVSSWRRLDDNAIPPRAKVTGSYVNSAFAKSEARLNGFDEAIVLNGEGHVSECSTANLVMVRDGVAVLPPATDDNLEGITRLQVRKILAGGLGLEVRERQIDRTELYAADELLLCGTGMGIAGIRSVDHRSIGNGTVGPICRALAAIYDDVVRARDARFGSEVVPVYAGAERPMPTISTTEPTAIAAEASISAPR